jgi:hypothetical protein
VRDYPMARMKPPRLPEEAAPVLREGDFRRLLEVCERDKSLAGRRDAAILQVLIDTGARRGEALGLMLEDVDPPRVRLRRGVRPFGAETAELAEGAIQSIVRGGPGSLSPSASCSMRVGPRPTVWTSGDGHLGPGAILRARGRISPGGISSVTNDSEGLLAIGDLVEGSPGKEHSGRHPTGRVDRVASDPGLGAAQSDQSRTDPCRSPRPARPSSRSPQPPKRRLRSGRCSRRRSIRAEETFGFNAEPDVR